MSLIERFGYLPFWKKTLILLAAFLGTIVLFNSFVMPWYVKQDTLVKVPSVVGLPFNEAQGILEDSGLEGLQGDIRYDPAKPIGTIIEQSPPAEQTVKYGRRIYLIMSGGEQLYDVPNLVGRSVREARFSLSQRNLQLIEILSRPSAQYPAGIVIEQVYPSGAKVKKGTDIGVILSAGMVSGNIKVPSLTGKNIEEAKKLILQSKLSVGRITSQPSTTVALNAVIDQYPKANSMVNENEKVDLIVNREIKKKVLPPVEDKEMNTMEEVKPEGDKSKNNEKQKDIDKEKKQEIKKDDKVPPADKKDDKKKDDKKKDDKSKDPENKDDGGTKF